MHQEKENKINTVVETALKNLNGLIDVNTIIGKPFITDDGDYVFPISKVTLGVLSGGGEYGKTGIFGKNDELPFSAGNGAVVSVKPSGFLIKNSDGYKLISAGCEPYSKLLDKATEIFEKLQGEKSE